MMMMLHDDADALITLHHLTTGAVVVAGEAQMRPPLLVWSLVSALALLPCRSPVADGGATSRGHRLADFALTRQGQEQIAVGAWAQIKKAVDAGETIEGIRACVLDDDDSDPDKPVYVYPLTLSGDAAYAASGDWKRNPVFVAARSAFGFKSTAKGNPPYIDQNQLDAMCEGCYVRVKLADGVRFVAPGHRKVVLAEGSRKTDYAIALTFLGILAAKEQLQRHLSWDSGNVGLALTKKGAAWHQGWLLETTQSWCGGEHGGAARACHADVEALIADNIDVWDVAGRPIGSPGAVPDATPDAGGEKCTDEQAAQCYRDRMAVDDAIKLRVLLRGDKTSGDVSRHMVCTPGDFQRLPKAQREKFWAQMAEATETGITAGHGQQPFTTMVCEDPDIPRPNMANTFNGKIVEFFLERMLRRCR
jgi:hypothetical protein